MRIVLVAIFASACSGSIVPRHALADGGASDGAALHPIALDDLGEPAASPPPDLARDATPTLVTPCGSCPGHAHCDRSDNMCACDPGYVASGGACAVAPVEDPASRGADEVCRAWAAGHVADDPMGFTPGPSACDPGTLSPAAIADTVRRINVYRWLVGLYPVDDDAGMDAADQACAVMIAANGQLNHMPPSTWKCWSQAAAGAAGSSNECMGLDTAGCIDLYADDGGVPSLGHRRWIMNPPLQHVGVGWDSGAQCLGVFGGGNMDPGTKWQAWPNPGPVPADVARTGTWSVHSDGIDFSQATVTVTRKDDGMAMPVTPTPLPWGYGVGAFGVTLGAWSPEAGRTYHVEVAGTSAGTIAYDVAPVDCP